ncbi:MAG: SDR family oxidoreductase [Clostridiales bacterium]|nr:SDR family oxidoreductase [Clostridiales bacterium]
MARYEELQDKRVVVTGGASGIGLATAKRFAKEGSKVVIFDWNEEALKQVLAENPDLAGGVVVDVSNPESVKEGFLQSDEILGGIDVLVSNAGISVRNLYKDADFEQWTKVLSINLNGMFLCSKEALSRMEKQKSGVILFTASTNGMEAHPYYADYNASKAGVILLGRTLALEYAPYIRVNSVCPGYVLTPMQRAEYTDEMLEKVNQGIPMKRHATPEEVAALFVFLASDEASYITGQHIPIDGGETA